MQELDIKKKVAKEAKFLKKNSYIVNSTLQL